MAAYKPLKEEVKTEFAKNLIITGERKSYISISKDGNRITYTASGKNYNFKNPEEKIRAAAYIELVERYKYDPKRMNQEISPPRREPKLPADIVVYEKERDRVFIVVETKAVETDKKIEEAKREGLGNANLHNARYLWIVCGTEKFAYDVYEKPALEELEKYRKADIPIAYGKEPKFKYKKADPEWDLNPMTFNELGRKFQLCHDEIWEGGKRDPSVAFDEMSKLMFIKIWDERFTEDGKYYRFQIGSQEEKRNVAIRIKDIYKDAQDKEPDVFKGAIELPDRLIYRLVEILQDFSFTKTDLDAKGRAFEKFLGMVFRGQFGQYFTRREIVEFMVDMLEPTKDDMVIDPACGSGGFLLYTIDRVRKKAKEVYKSSPRTIDEIYWNFPRDSIFGIDNNDRIARVAMMDMVIHDDGHTNIENNNALFDYSRFSPKRDIRPGKYTLLMTNPPFGSKETNPEILKLHELGSKIKKRKSQRSEILFIERCLDLLRPGGRIGIVLPDGILTNSTLQYVRDFIERKARILAAVSLPQSAFVPAGAGVKASLLFLKKKNYDDEELGNYPIFMAIAEHIGYDTTGRPDKNELFEKKKEIVNGKEVEAPIIPSTGILGEYKQFLEGKTKFNPGFVVMKNELEERFDPYYYKVEFRELIKKLEKGRYKTVELGELLLEMSGGATPKVKGKAYLQNHGIPFLRIQNITEEGIKLDDVKYITKETHEGLLKRSQLKPKDLIFTITGRIGTTAVVLQDFGGGNINQHSVRMHLKKDINENYVAVFLNSNIGRALSLRKISGGTRIALDYPAIKSIRIPLPPREVQNKIANIMEEAYREKKEKLAKTKEVMGSIELYMLNELGIQLPETKKRKCFLISLDKVRNKRFDPYYFKPEFEVLELAISNGKYKTVAFEEIIKDMSGGATPRAKGDSYLDKPGIPFLRIQNITKDGIKLDDVLYINEKTHNGLLRRSKLKSNDLIFTITGRIGTAAIVPGGFGPGNINQHSVRISFKEGANPHYVAIYLNTELGNKLSTRKVSGGTRIALDYGAIKSLLIPIPPLQVQQKIVKEVQSRREQAKELREEAIKIVEQAKEKVEKIILGKQAPLESSEVKSMGTLPLRIPEKVKPSKPPVQIKYKEYQMLDGSKKNLVQQVGNGSIIKRFDKTPLPKKKTDVVCPHFLELKWATGCPYDCSWCYLKGTLRFLPYKTNPRLKDPNRIKEHVETFLEWVKGPEILNTGELADSLMYEGNKKSFVNFIVPLFENQNRHKVLFLTKSDRVQNLLELGSHKQVITSFSLNAIPVARQWELKAPSVERRIKAAKSLYDKGYEVRIRIDPMVPVDNWERLYLDLIDILFDSITPERITLGSLRGLQSTINGTTDTSWVKYLSEYSNWGRKIEINLRLAMYRKLISYLKEKHNYQKVALCKETVAVWEILKMDYRKIRCNCIW